MNDDEIESFLAGLPPMSDEEKIETVLGYVNEVIKHMSTVDLLAFRARVVAMYPGTAEQNTMVDVIDGLLAVRAINDAI